MTGSNRLSRNTSLRAGRVYSVLKNNYPGARTALKYSGDWQLLVSVILSAQCTDERVNKVTAGLFADHPDVSDYASMDPGYLESRVRSCGFFRNKARNIIEAAKLITEEYGGRVPDTMREMTRLPGVARKTANVVLGNAYGVVEGIAVDTHVMRVSRRLGLTGHKDPVKIEKDLMRIFPRTKWFRLTYLFIEHGRAVCKAPVPLCSGCPVRADCPREGVTRSR